MWLLIVVAVLARLSSRLGFLKTKALAETTARWCVRAFANGGVMETCGQSTDIDTRFPHGQGAGLQALVFDY